MYPPDLAQAEAAMDKRDYIAAEPLLKKVVDHNAANFRAWFDLGFVDNAIGRPDDAIAAYRKAVAAKPDVFESNLNLGLCWRKPVSPTRSNFCAPPHIEPTAQVDEGHARAWMGLARVLEASPAR